jgi:dTDP-glucose 4,6-dehydratase
MNTPIDILVTGGAGFIGSNFVLRWVADGGRVVNFDLQTYAGNPENLVSIFGNSNHILIRGDIADSQLIADLLGAHRPQAIVHFAAESHVDRSIAAPDAFIRTNVNGTFTLLEQARLYWSSLAEPERSAFRFLHVSTDEVYGCSGPMVCRSPRQLPMPRTARMRPPRLRPITWCGPGVIHTACPL